MKAKNSDRLKEILVAKHHQIVALKFIQIEMLKSNPELASKISHQIENEESVYKSLMKVIDIAENSEPRKTGWFSGHVRVKEDRLANIMD